MTGYTWNPLNQLTQITKTGAPTETMWYLPGGERILHKDATGVHLFLGGMLERHKNLAGVMREQRFYTIGATMIGVRTKEGTGPDETFYTLGDIRGSATLTIKRNTLGVSQQQWYGAYGSKRAGNLDTTSRGYIGQTSDKGGLNYLHNRYQDPTIGIFLSVDPLIQKTGEPYLYASGNPTTLKDPTGLDVDDRGPCADQYSRTTCNAWVTAEVQATQYLATGEDPENRRKYKRRYDRASNAKAALEQLGAGGVNIKWARCVAQSGIGVCGDAGLIPKPGDQPGMLHQPNQTAWALGHFWAAANLYTLRGQAEAQGNAWIQEFGGAANSLQHAYWMALNAEASWYTPLTDDALRELGYAHEKDWTEDVIESAKDVLNNEVGIKIGNNYMWNGGDLIKMIETAARNGDLFCRSEGQISAC